MIKYPHTLKNNIYHSNKREPPPFFHLVTNTAIDHVLVHSVDKTYVLVVTVELICSDGFTGGGGGGGGWGGGGGGGGVHKGRMHLLNFEQQNFIFAISINY